MMAAVKTSLTLCLALVLLTACAAKTRSVAVDMREGRPQVQAMKPELQQNINRLANALLTLGPGVSRAEAINVAHDAYAYPLYLANKWEVTWPPLYHNTLRNAGVRKWGLCTDWASAMVDHMRKKYLHTFDIYWAVAERGNLFREHSSLLITAKGQPFSSGIILDPWRDSGDLYWSRHVDDPSYDWEYHAGPYAPLPRRGPAVGRIIM